MCGIVSIVRFDGKAARRMVAKRYQSQKIRGQRGFGFVAIGNDGKIIDICRSTTEAEILPKLEEKKTASMILFHHRAPTSSPNFEEETHPIFVSNPLLEHDYYVVHNGVITNDVTLKESHEKLGIKYSTEMSIQYVGEKNVYPYSSTWNDSESLAVELALVLEGKKKNIDTKGSVAFVLYQIHKETGLLRAMYYGRNTGNPLNFYSNKDFMSLCSQGLGTLIEPDVMFRYDVRNGEISSMDIDIGWVYEYNQPKEPAAIPPRQSKWGYDRDGDDYNVQTLPSGRAQETSVFGKEYDAIIAGAGDLDPDEHLMELYSEYEDIENKLQFARTSGSIDDINELMILSLDIQRRIENFEEAMENKRVQDFIHDSNRQ